MTLDRSFRLYNSLTRTKEDFVPLEIGHARIYACGPTVYSYAHIGNARMAVVFDVLARVLRVLYPKVTYASNITDIEDKIIAASQETGQSPEQITRKFERIYNEDMAALGVALPDIQPRATETIPEMIKLMEQLIERGHAYVAEGHVLFHVPSFPEYGGLSGRSRDDQIAGARVDVAPYKRDPADFVLWKPSTPEQPGWDSPWGRGRPGWHIECSAMSEKFLGLPIDIHGGGADLKFPHHENEIAQSCCAHGHHDLAAFSRYWMHNGFLTVEGEKMSKSLGNFILAHDLIEQGIKGEVIRYVLLSAHYRQPLDWSEGAVEQAQKSLDKFYRILDELKDVADISVPVPDGVMEALCDDLNTPKAYAELNVLAKAAHEQKTPEAKAALVAAGHLMGFLNENPAIWLAANTSGVDAAWVEGLLNERTEARAAKNFARSDEIRDELAAKGVVIEDTPQGPKWKVA
ncbi:MAG TPA: cysteine--tRNA ligase [Alphaproteobacteria bacterium]|nr:cysteine--tRNA ligase [Alphaproteobacteria bacterium]HNS44138.1 cysteine--tRNA ligase [Alphaproteobacteria bacterium]